MDYDIVLETSEWFAYLYHKGMMPIILGPFDTERDASLAVCNRLADSAEGSEYANTRME